MLASRGWRSPASPVPEPGVGGRRRRRLRVRAGWLLGSAPGISWPGLAAVSLDPGPGRDPGDGRRRRRVRAGRVPGAASAAAERAALSPAAGSAALSGTLSAPGAGATMGGRRRRRRRLRRRRMGRDCGASSGRASALGSPSLVGATGPLASGVGAVVASPEAGAAVGLRRRRRRRRRSAPSCMPASGACSPDEGAPPAGASGKAAAASGCGLFGSCPAAPPPASDSVGSRAGPSLAVAAPVPPAYPASAANSIVRQKSREARAQRSGCSRLTP